MLLAEPSLSSTEVRLLYEKPSPSTLLPTSQPRPGMSGSRALPSRNQASLQNYSLSDIFPSDPFWSSNPRPRAEVYSTRLGSLPTLVSCAASQPKEEALRGESQQGGGGRKERGLIERRGGPLTGRDEPGSSCVSADWYMRRCDIDAGRSSRALLQAREGEKKERQKRKKKNYHAKPKYACMSGVSE